jgi:hypothetical protein
VLLAGCKRSVELGAFCTLAALSLGELANNSPSTAIESISDRRLLRIEA